MATSFTLPGVLGVVGSGRKTTAILVLLAVLVRVLTGLSGYSGAGDAPKYGDYEAQRHWMELTINLPVSEWYTDSPVNNGSYWPLDYPPLSGYQSWLCGVALRALEPAAVELVSSHGYETPSSKIVMRWTVIVADLLVYFPACLFAVYVFYDRLPAAAAAPSTTRAAERTLALIALLFNPTLLLTDHGHFQYNGIGLGLTLGAMAAIGAGRRLVGSVLFVLALNHKQMTLFFAPAFFAHLLGWALNDPAHRSVGSKVLAVAKLGVTVIAAFAVCWSPWLTSVDDALRVLGRIFPIRRGLYEDYVANWWCTTSLLVKWKVLFAPALLLRAAAGATLAVAAPAMLHQVLRPSPRGLVRCAANTAFAFFMFSYQVHEKSILLPLLPVTLLAGPEPLLGAWLPLLAALSMYPLLVRDGVALPYAALCTAYGSLMAGAALALAREQWRLAGARGGAGGKAEGAGAAGAGGVGARVYGAVLGGWGVLSGLAVVVALALHAAKVLVPPPAWLPWLHDRTFITFAFAGFTVSFLYLQVMQWREGAAAPGQGRGAQGGEGAGAEGKKRK